MNNLSRYLSAGRSKDTSSNTRKIDNNALAKSIGGQPEKSRARKMCSREQHANNAKYSSRKIYAMLSQDDHHMYVDPWILNVLFTQLIHKSLPDACMLKNAHNVTHYQQARTSLQETFDFLFAG